MKKCFLALLITSLLLTSCGNDEWEYKIVNIKGNEHEDLNDYMSLEFGNQQEMLNKLGNDGWELINVYCEQETVFPNFGNKEYVTGLQSNTRTKALNFILKRKK